MIFREPSKLWVVSLRELDDPSLMALIAQKNEAALSEIYDRYHRLIMSIAYHVVGDWQTAEEITLDIFTTVWKKAGSYQAERADVRTWLTRITRNRAIDVLRREKSRPHRDSVNLVEAVAEAVSSPANPETATDLALQKQRIRTAVATLPEAQKEMLFLAYFRGYSQSELAETLNIPLGTVKTRIRSAMQKLRKLLVEEIEDQSDKSI